MAGPSFKLTIKQDQKAMADLQKKLRDIPNKMKTRELTKIARAGGTVVVKRAKKIVPVGTGMTSDGRKRDHLRDSLDKKVKGYKARGTAAAIVGHRSRRAPHAHLVHDGTKPHTIRVGRRTSATGQVTASIGRSGLPPRALSNQRRFFGTQVRHPGVRPFPYLKKATDRSKGEVLQKMGKKARQILEKLAKE